MTIRMHSPGCPCCDPCNIPIGGWSTSDDWTINDPDLYTPDSSAIAISVNEHPDSESSHVITALVKGLDAGDQARLIVAYDDADNYLFGQIEFGNPTGKLRLYKRVAGTNTELVDAASPDISAAKELTHRLRICYDSQTEILRATFTNSSGGNHSRTYSVTATGTKIGVGTGTVSNTVYFEDVAWTYSSIDCPGCGVACAVCVDGLAPPVVKLVLSGMSNYDPPPDNVCDCSGANGTYLLASQGGFPLCEWLAIKSLACDDPPTVGWFIQAGAYREDFGDGIVAYINVIAFGARFRKIYEVDPTPCEWDDEDIPFWQDEGFIRYCTGVSATCKITAIGLDG